MSPEAIFNLTNMPALIGWLALALAPIKRDWALILAGRIIPLTFAVLYTALILAYWAEAEGGYGSLPDVMTLLSHPGMATAGWLHFLAFDLFVGAWITQDAVKRNVPHAAILPCLVLTFLFGPVGLLIYFAIAFTLSATRRLEV